MSTAMSDDFKLIKVGLRDWETPENRYAAQRALDRVRAAYAAATSPAAEGAKAARLPFAILDDELAALRRFDECVSDGEGYDVPKAKMKRLAQIGLVRHCAAGYYEHTNFGLSVLNGDFADQQPSRAESQPAEVLSEESIKDALRATGHLTHDQAWECAEVIAKLLAASSAVERAALAQQQGRDAERWREAKKRFDAAEYETCVQILNHFGFDGRDAAMGLDNAFDAAIAAAKGE